jgi:ABC-type polysaccharide/polyol phosphate transport system ATPase subunit
MQSSIDTRQPSPRSSESEAGANIAVQGLSKQFYFYQHRTTTMREWFIRKVMGRPIHVRNSRFALQDVNFNLAAGESVAIIGANGSGKSTLLRIMAGIYEYSTGSVETRGRIAAVIELGTGFHPELTGMENIRIYASILGLRRAQLASRINEIVDFSGVGEFLDTPIKFYSSGMVTRLAFSVAVCVDSEILMLDEVLAVGDESFRTKCLARICEYLGEGKILVFATHSLEQASAVCTRALWLHQGRLQMDGPIEEVAAAYQQFAAGLERGSGA